jgi:hypothetical protein
VASTLRDEETGDGGEDKGPDEADEGESLEAALGGGGLPHVIFIDEGRRKM